MGLTRGQKYLLWQRAGKYRLSVEQVANAIHYSLEPTRLPKPTGNYREWIDEHLDRLDNREFSDVLAQFRKLDERPPTLKAIDDDRTRRRFERHWD